MTNSFSNIYAIGIVTIVAYLVAELLKEPPIYDSLLQAASGQNNLESVANLLSNEGACGGKFYGCTATRLGITRWYIDLSIRRNGTYIVPLGDVKLEPGDELQVSCERGTIKSGERLFSIELVA